jgi:putative nucleotidyltransferase with HDIG domain
MSNTGTTSAEKAKRVELILAQLDSLPTLPAVAARLLQLTTASETNARQIVQLIQSDQSLTAKILSLARRAATGAGGSALTVDRAVVLMGFDTVRNAVLSMKVFETFGPRHEGEQTAFNRPEFWKHSLAVACAAHQLAATGIGRIDPEEAFVCGLLHDLGKVALDTCLPKSFDRVVQLTNKSRLCIADVERQILGVDHTVIGRRLGERWGLPETVVQCMWLHHHGPDSLPASISHKDHIQIIHLADLIVRHQRIGYSGNWPFGESPVDLAERMRVTRRSYDQILQELPDHIEQRSTIIGLEDLPSKGLYVRAIAEANEELARLNASLHAMNCRLQVRSKYFQGLCHLTQSISPRAPMAHICSTAAQTIRMALGLGPVLVFARNTQEGYLELSLVEPDAPAPATEILTPGQTTLLGDQMDEAIVEGTIGGSWLIPVSPPVQEILERYAAPLGTGPHWFLPIVRDRRWVGGALFAAPATLVAARRNDVGELESLSTAIGLIMANATVQQAADQLSEDLADVTRRMQQMHDQVLQTRSLSKIAEMASGAGHELNNPLAIINGRAQLLRDRTADPEIRRVLELISEQAHRCSEIVSELMDFARPQPPNPRALSLAHVIQKVRASWLAKSWLTEPRFVVELSDALPTVWCDPAQFEQILEELISNSVEAMDSKEGRLAINCRTEVSDDRVVLTVEDNGRGMDADVLGKAFDPFFSSRPAGRGRGLGLARAYRLVDVNGGRLRLESTPGSGTTAVIELPTGPPGVMGATDSAISPVAASQLA